MNFGTQHLCFLLLLVGGLIFSIGKKKLTPVAAVTGAICGTLIYLGSGYTGFLMMTTFFLLGTIATGIGRRQKQQLEKSGDDTKRNSLQVLANAGMATFLAALCLIDPPHQTIYQLLLAASFASATADTLSSELGMIYGTQSYNCITWKKEAKGLDGVISVEGTLAGIIGAVIIAIIYVLHYGYSVNYGFNGSFLCLVLAGAIGNHADSIIGATLERRKYLNNDAVNFISTVIAAGCAYLLSLFLI